MAKMRDFPCPGRDTFFEAKMRDNLCPGRDNGKLKIKAAYGLSVRGTAFYHDDGDDQPFKSSGRRFGFRDTDDDSWSERNDQPFRSNNNSYRRNEDRYGDRPSRFGGSRFQRQDRFGGDFRTGRFGGDFRTGRFGGDFRRGRDDDFSMDTPSFSGEDVPQQMDFYNEHPNVTNRSMEEVAKFLKDHDISCIGQNVDKPVFTFEEANFPEYIQKTLMQQDFEKPTSIQSVTWPLASSGRDVIGIAQTGSGKTLAFMLPALVHIMNQNDRSCRDGPIALVMTPTRELCQQVTKVSQAFSRACKINSVAVFGGAKRHSQLADIRAGAPILVATPGRLNDLTSSGELTLNKVTYLVLDEADRMLDMGFEPQIQKIVRQIRKNRQTLMWSATWPKDIQRLASKFLKDPVEIHVGTSDLVANPDIEQRVKLVDDNDKIPKITSDCLHGDKDQRERDSILADFRSGRSFILIATDVASRGLGKIVTLRP
ncbi:hypothetical protein FSP39_000015 [Pinctada imbricata]|uniref:RNA helicase n=1 Tax=Pinctada imbricata TaxID=66713 RepID=A0AA88XNU6_PINIB|nr:hypothetical protein FSP39_000015 [Pinctada imbricata]